jgi:hypothetical protein
MYNFWLDIVLPLGIISIIVFRESKRKKFGPFGRLLRCFVGNYDIPWYEKEENQEILKEIQSYEKQRHQKSPHMKNEI